MPYKKTIIGLVLLVLVAAGVTVYAQMVRRPFHNGSVWNITYVRMKPGMETAYLNYVANDWKRQQEAAKADGLILSYKVIATEEHGPTDYNLMLMVEFKDLATLEANERKADALAQRVIGNDEKQMQGYRERLEIREIIGERLAREIVLSPAAQ
jgi:hypothetical protein